MGMDETHWDVAGILGVAVVLVVVHLLPAGLREGLMLSYDAPAVYQFLTAAYVHRTWAHLGANVGMYLAFALLGYALCVRAGRRGVFRAGFVYGILVVPVVVSGLNLWFLDVESGAGFSGVVAGFLGMVPVFLALLLAERGVVDGHEVPMAFIMLGLAGIAYRLAGVGWELLAVLVYGMFLFALVVRDSDGIDAILDRLGRLDTMDQTLLNLAISLCIVLPYGLVAPGGSPSGVTNIFGHLVGYAVGFSGVYVGVVVGERWVVERCCSRTFWTD